MNRRRINAFCLSLTLVTIALTSHATVVSTPNSDQLGTVRIELEEVLKADQAGRWKLEAVQKEHGLKSPEVQALWQSITVQDAVNLKKVEAILAKYGWLGPEEIGPEANSALFYVIQHADISVQQKYVPMMRAAAAEKKAFPALLAMLEDRIAIREGRPQIYGSQLVTDNETGEVHISPIDDPDHLDERRKSIGLPPMRDYVRHWKLTWDLAAFKNNLALETELMAISAEVEKGFQEQAKAEKDHGRNSADSEQVRNAVAARNTAAFAKIKIIIDAHGWPTPGQVGIEASMTAPQLLLYADPADQKKYLPSLREVVHAKHLDPYSLAMVEDTMAREEGHSQIYGTLLDTDEKTGVLSVLPIGDPDHVDGRRASLGLPPMAEAAQKFHFKWNVQPDKSESRPMKTEGETFPAALAK